MPHEVDMTKALIMQLEDWWAEEPGARPVATVILQVGEFTCVEPALLVSSFAQQREDKPFLREAELQVRNSPFIAYCDTCQQEYQPDLGQQYACPTCGLALHNIRSGRELRIERVEWVEL